jgi:hypothetical protein
MGIWTIVLALGVPIAWGLLSAWAFDWWQARRRSRSTDQDSGCAR